MDSILIQLQNPWWMDKGWVQTDPHLTALVNSPVYFERPELHTLSLEPGSFHILRGPRQVGKTTLLKQWISLLLSRAETKNVFYLSCEGIEEFKELQEILADWFKGRKGSASYVFLDEISFVSEWQRAVLWASNLGFLKDACLLITGSNARDLKKSGERFPGRRGKGRDLELHPLSLADYVKLPCFKGKEPSELLDIYFQVGGFPHALRDWANHGCVSDETYLTYRNWIIGDAARFRLAEETLRHLFFRIAETLTTRMTWTSLIETTPVKSHETALEYLEHLSEAFLCHIHYCYDPQKGGAAFHKSRKLYLIDPILYHLAHAWRKNIVNIGRWSGDFLASSNEKAKLLESLYVVGASHRFPQVFYWYSSKTKQEVDLVAETSEGLRLYEVKWQARAPYQALGQPVEILDRSRILPFFTEMKEGHGFLKGIDTNIPREKDRA